MPSDSYEIGFSLLRHSIREQLYAGATSFRKTALEDAEWDWSSSAACDEGLRCSDVVSRPRIF